MDFQSILGSYQCRACIISVDVFPNEKYGNIRVVTGNKAHANEYERIWGHSFVDNIPYDKCFPLNLNFEYDCYRCAVLHQQFHTFADITKMGIWAELYFLPLESDKENTGYCLFSYNLITKPDAFALADVSPEIAFPVLASCIKLHSASEFIDCIKEVIDDIRDICDARRCCILLMDIEAGECKILSDSSRKNETTKPTGESASKSFYRVAVKWEETLAGSTSLIIKNEQDMQVIKERNPEWYESLKRGSVETLVLFPLKYNGKLVGYMWSSNFDVKNVQKIKGVFELSTFFLAARIANYQLVKRLEVLSSIDLLTGIKNRNAMNNRVAEFTVPGFVKPENIGIVFADLNGLKRVNDQKGHEAGDMLIKKAVAILQMIFDDAELYRAGGDEFMIIYINTSLKNIEEKVEYLRKTCEKEDDVRFSIGVAFDEDEVDICKAMSTADERMYEDKEEYYRKHPEKKYR